MKYSEYSYLSSLNNPLRKEQVRVKSELNSNRYAQVIVNKWYIILSKKTQQSQIIL